MESEFEQALTCPYCGSTISILLDPTVDQEYIEDCEVCCKPISIQYTSQDGEIVEVEVKRDDE